MTSFSLPLPLSLSTTSVFFVKSDILL
ncbi:hypothetical protein E2C01_094527 [Portunus trituberculatus]|uniref:Uncharacterized protein n=1 Tax=Portunus trituberculatus TaxID=210409 RepID=A0A5B7JMD2_PORTR|nr:hypothetical protein [Portunus trituberculatus]